MTFTADEASVPLCGGCLAHGQCRLGVGALVRDGAATRAAVICAKHFHAGPQVAHGGWTAAVFDDVMGRSTILRGAPAVTGTMTVDFLKPVPVEEALVVEVLVEGNEGRRWMLSATLRLARGDVPLARAHGVWIERREDHFERHEAAMDAYRNSEG